LFSLVLAVPGFELALLYVLALELPHELIPDLVLDLVLDLDWLIQLMLEASTVFLTKIFTHKAFYPQGFFSKVFSHKKLLGYSYLIVGYSPWVAEQTICKVLGLNRREICVSGRRLRA
jgi:hypothetical protein